jgi:hypothetical protein
MDDMDKTDRGVLERRQMRKTRAIALFVLGAVVLFINWGLLTAVVGRPTDGDMAMFAVGLLVGLALVAGGGILLDKNRRERYESRRP